MVSCTVTSHGIRNAFDYLSFEIFALLVTSNVLHFFLQYLGQPSIISQLLAGIVAGRTVMSRTTKFAEDTGGLVNQMDEIVQNCRVYFLFLIGLEMDIIYLRQNFHKSTLIAFVCITICVVLTLPLSSILYHLLAWDNANFSLFVLMITLFLSSTASPVLVRIVSELKLTYSNTGKLAIASAIVNDITVVIFLAFYSIEMKSEQDHLSEARYRIFDIVIWFIVTTLSILFMTWMVKTCNGCHPEKRYINDFKLWGILILTAWISNAMDDIGYSSTSMSFLLGLFMPREGRITRLILEKLSFPVHHIIMPLYFSGILVNMDLHDLAGENVSKMITTAFLIAILCIVGKVLGAVIVVRFFHKMHVKDGVVLGILLSVKGHLDTIIVAMGAKFGLWNKKTVMLLTFIIIINTFIACPVVRLIVSWERKVYRYNSQSLQHLEQDDQPRILTCVHQQQEVKGMLTLSSLFVGDDCSFKTISLLHLVELTKKSTVGLLYNQLSPRYFSWERGVDDHKEVSIAVAMFTNNISGVSIQHSTVVSSYKSMHEDICMHAEEVRACLVLLPFHKEKRYDGKMVCRKEERRQVNLKAFQHAPCTIGIFVDRSACRSMSIKNPSINKSIYTTELNKTIIDQEMPEPHTPTGRLHQVVAIFFGGPDDREAASFMARAAQHPSVNATLVRFHLETQNSHIDACSSRCMSEFSVIVDLNTELELDENFLADYQQRYVPGTVTYIERHVSNGPELVSALVSMAGSFTLFIVGKEGPQISALMRGIRDWEECPELGPIGDLLASNDIMNSSSVLILQQHKVPKNKARGGQNTI